MECIDFRSSLGFAIGRADHLLRREVRRALSLAGIDLSPEEAIILFGLAAAGKPCSMGYFSEIMIRDATTLTRQIDRLVQKRWVERHASEHDGRVMLVHLTATGQKVIQAAFPVFQQVRQRALSKIDPADIATTIRTLQRMQANLLEE